MHDLDLNNLYDLLVKLRRERTSVPMDTHIVEVLKAVRRKQSRRLRRGPEDTYPNGEF